MRLVRPHPHAGLRRRQARGFSLIELILVATILVVVAGLVSVALGAGIGGDRQVSAARDLASTIRLTADRARLVGRPHRLRIHLADGELEVQVESDPLDSPGVWESIPYSWGKRRRFGEGVRIAELAADADDEDAVQRVDGELIAELAIVFDPEGVHRLAGVLPEDEVESELDPAEDAFDPLPDEGGLIQIAIGQIRYADQPDNDWKTRLTVRLEPTGEVRVWTAEELAAHLDSLGMSSEIPN